ncbi:EDD domain protein, DegV family [Corynebacterium accolens ATCC 49726]|uniref:DegV family protein n=1 Tax=Corynebacterium accolens TaxID=38284 RepID=UPI0001E16DE2|nr:DegV family protein [Corynebacterium accolens]EFM43021.1 EDD domain protein, DegV family [Corynebacterium accolens ATCC 49726]MDK4294919.1 DegV family protein [Corynebacterium accolens]WKS62050.1 DegV family protein [Corynebacterium accolens]
MTVRVITDSAASLPPEIAAELDITVIDLHVMDSEDKGGKLRTTSGLSSLELAAAYGREMEKAQDDGVIAIHLSKELSSTWSAAVAAAGVFPDTVRVIDSGSAGMVMGAAAMAAATKAAQGAALEECHAAALDSIERAATWVYLHSMEDMRRSGRMSAATAMLSTALLATKPIMSIVDGKLELVGKTRTQTKAFTKVVEIIAARAAGEPAFIAIQHNQASEAADKLQGLLHDALPEGTSFITTPLTEVLAVHAGPSAIGVSAVFSS